MRSRPRRLVVSLLLPLLSVACARAPSRAPLGPRELYVVAHEDDDLLFMNPDIRESLLAGDRVRVVYVTAGDSGLTDGHWQRREQGALAGTAKMVGVANEWTSEQRTILGKPVRVATLSTWPAASAVFLRLPNGNPYGSGYPSTGLTSIEKLWIGTIPEITTVDYLGTYSKQDLVDVLAALMDEFEATGVATMDSSNLYGFRTDGGVGTPISGEHSDHVYSAFFAFEAQQAHQLPHALKMYRSYNVADAPKNVSPDDQAVKWAAFSAYAPYDMCFDQVDAALTQCLDDQATKLPYAQWTWRQYSFAKLSDQGGRIVGWQGGCLAGDPGSGSVTLEACGEAPAQRWTVFEDGTIRDQADRCLDVTGGSAANGTAVVAARCRPVPQDQWAFMDNGQVRGLDGKCLQANGTSTAVEIDDCARSERQVFSIERR
jgi:LmbE family N-acetylglucosaminyl deacetylase